MRFLIFLLAVCAFISWKWPDFKRQMRTEHDYGASAKFVARLNDQMPLPIIPNRLEMRRVVLEDKVARFYLQALGTAEIKEQKQLDDTRVQLRRLYCGDLHQFADAGISVEFIANSAVHFEDIRTRAISVRTDPSDCTRTAQ